MALHWLLLAHSPPGPPDDELLDELELLELEELLLDELDELLLDELLLDEPPPPSVKLITPLSLYTSLIVILLPKSMRTLRIFPPFAVDSAIGLIPDLTLT